MSDLT